MGFFFNPFFDGDGFLSSQLLLIFGAQTGCLVVALLAARSLECGLAFVDDLVRWTGEPGPNKALRFSIFDILVVTAAAA